MLAGGPGRAAAAAHAIHDDGPQQAAAEPEVETRHRGRRGRRRRREEVAP